MSTAAAQAPSEKGWLSSAWTAVMLSNPITAPLYAGYKASEWVVGKISNGIDGAKADALTSSADPSKLILDQLAKNPAFQGPEGQARLQEIRSDKAFTTALNNAIARDKTVAPGLIAAASGKGGEGMDANELAASLADPTKRGVYTQVLTAVAQSPSDKLNFGWMQQIGSAASKNEYGKVRDLLAQGGIKNEALDIAADPSQLFGMAMNDPKSFGTKMSSMMGLSGAQGAQFSKLFEGLANFLQMIWGDKSDPNSYAHFFDKHGGGMLKGLQDLSGYTDNNPKTNEPDAVGSSGNPRTGVPIGQHYAAAASGAAAPSGPQHEPEVLAARSSKPAHAPA